jgi:uncharacterized membrane protein YvbJ
MTVDFTAAKRARESDPNKVKCAHCGSAIEARATRCPKCGTHFLGLALQFTHESDELQPDRERRRRRLRVIAAVVALLFAAGLALLFWS